ncbi:MAG: thioredoxin domain-containing protein [Calditrichaeota bacterium]|nr:thioredoxin domain-containing protein [Calditrichota bacterium]
MPKFTNRLINETSPYLLQHAHNPVDWYPWGEEAFAIAQKENKPIFLSVGYSSCHWCHVMEHESFENEEIAKMMNEHFVCIKVDREERPDIDQLYMEFVQMTTGSGGWPMSVFLTPDQKPFYGGTYFPPDDRYGRPGFKRLLMAMSNFYHNEKVELHKNLEKIDHAFLAKSAGEKNNSGDMQIPQRQDWNNALEQLSGFYEPTYGGIGRAPKFPAVNVFSLFLREYRNSGEPQYLNMVEHTLQKMANGGIYDQIGGGFARYSVDEKWLVPHFEKMLYDNGQLVQLYLDTYLVTGKEYYLNIAEETLEFTLREMTSPEGGFYSSLDADSEGEEGKFYVWQKEEIDDILGADAEIFNAFFGVTHSGNFEGHNILNVVSSVEQLSKKFDRSVDEISKILKDGRKKLLLEREKRIRPGLDDKVISSWNGLMLSAFARAYQITRNEKYKNVIEKNISFLRKNLIIKDKLKRTYKAGKAKYDAFIEDYAIVTNALLDSYEALFIPEYIALAIQLNDYANAHFWDYENGGYFTASDQQEKLIRRMKDASDTSLPSGGGVMLMNNLRLFSYTEKEEYYQISEKILKKYAAEFSQNPYGFGSYLAALDMYLEKPKEVLIARETNQNVNAFLELLFGTYNPNKVVMLLSGGDDYSALTASLVKGKQPIDGKVTAYVCQNFACSLPVFSVEDLKNLMADNK